MVSYLYQAPAGVPGDIVSADESAVEQAFLITPFPANYGVAMKYATGGITPFVAADAAAVFAGVLVRAVPGISQSSSNEAVDVFQPNQLEVQGLCTRGYINVLLGASAGTPVRGAIVYIVQTASSGHLAGAFETTANAGNNVALTGTIVGNVTWASDGVDAFGNAVIRIAQ